MPFGSESLRLDEVEKSAGGLVPFGAGLLKIGHAGIRFRTLAQNGRSGVLPIGQLVLFGDP